MVIVWLAIGMILGQTTIVLVGLKFLQGWGSFVGTVQKVHREHQVMLSRLEQVAEEQARVVNQLETLYEEERGKRENCA